MFRFCTCRGGSASSLERSRNRVTIASCKICGGKPLVDGRGFLSGSMPTSVGLELTTVFNPDLTWKTISKGNRSVARRPRKAITRTVEGSATPAAGSVEGSDKEDSKRLEDLPVSESEKLGVTILGRRFSGNIEHIPIKKRRFLFHSPSPPPCVPSPHHQNSSWTLNSQRASAQKDSSNSTANMRVMAIASAVAKELGEVVNDDGKDLQDIHEDFSGISILAAAACSKNIIADASNNEEGSADEKLTVQEGSSEILVTSGSLPVSEESCPNHSQDISAAVKETAMSLETAKDCTKNLVTMTRDVVDGKNMRSSVCQDKDDGTLRNLESSSRDDRLHWDLNVVMDAWMNPCEDPVINSRKTSVHGATSGDALHNENAQRGTEDSIERKVRQLVEPKDCFEPEDSRRLVPGFHESDRELHRLDVCKDAEKFSSFQKKVIPYEIDDSTEEDLVKETKLGCDVEKFNSDADAAEDGARVNHFSCAEVEGVASKSLSEETIGEESRIHICKQREADCGADAGGEMVTSKNPWSQKCDVSLYDSVISEGASPNDEDVDRGSDLLINGYSPKIKRSLDAIYIEAPQLHLLNDDGMGVSDGYGVHTPPDSEEMSNLDVSVANSELVTDACGSLQVKDEVNLGIGEAALVDSYSEKSTHKLSGWTTEVVETQMALGSLSSDEACRIYDHPENSPDKVALEDPFEDSDYDSDVSHDEPEPVPMIEKEIEHHTGYDSQYEDGELRESTENNWEDEAGEEVEAEHVDYRSDNRRTRGYEAPEDAEVGNVDFEGHLLKVNAKCQPSIQGLSSSSIIEHGSSKERTVRAVKQQPRGHHGMTLDVEKLKMDAKVDEEATAAAGKGTLENNSCMGTSPLAGPRKLSGWDKFPESCQSSADITTEAREGGSGGKNDAGAHVDGMDSEDPTTGIIGSTAQETELPSCIEGPTSSETLLRMDRSLIQANRANKEYSNPRVEMDASSAKLVGRDGSSVHMHGRDRGINNWVDSSRGNWAQNRRSSPSYYSPAKFVKPGVKNAAAAAAAKVESNGFLVAPDGTIIKAGIEGPSPSGRVQRQAINTSSHVGHQSISRRVSPTDRDEAFGVRAGLGPVGEIRPDGSKGLERNRSGRYGPRVVRLGPRERFNGSLPDDGINSSIHGQNIPPIHRRGTYLSQPCTRSRSRSRTWSPNVWPSTRGRCSRSPSNYRSDTRVDRMRSPHRRPGFGPDHIGGFALIPRRHGSPLRRSRWDDDRTNSMDHFRERGYKQRSSASGRGSPGRIFRRNYRYVNSPERMRPDEYYSRPMHLGRFPNVVGTGRSPRYDASDDDKRKHGDRFGMVHQIRRNDTDEPVKRFQYDIEDGFAIRSSRNKDISGGLRSSRGGNLKEDYVRGFDGRLGEAPRGAGGRDDKGHFRYGRDLKYNSNPKSFGIKECEDDIAPKRRRP